jgi:hypothetical protein
MRDDITEGGGGTNIDGLAAATGQMRGTCGSCHTASNSGPRVRIGGDPPTGVGELANRMIEHLWDADRILEGLIGPSDTSWNAGATGLAQESLFHGEIVAKMSLYDPLQ